jgi:hypothetical protein
MNLFQVRGVYESHLGIHYMVVMVKGNKVKLLSKPSESTAGMKFRIVPNQVETGWRYLHDQIEH